MNNNMKDNYLTSRKMKLIVPLSLLFIIALVCFFVFSDKLKNIMPDESLVKIEYLEDVHGTMTIHDVSGENKTETIHHIWKAAPRLMKGNSTSTWWVRINTEDLIQNQKMGRMYLSILNPSVEKVALFIPTYIDSNVDYLAYYAGWGYPKDEHQDEGFAYPVFQLPENITGDYVYLKLSSSYTNNFTFRVMDEDALNKIKSNTIGIITFFTGLLVAFGINIFVQYSSLSLKVQLYYIIYLCTFLIYQVTLLGVIRLPLGKLAEVMIANVPAFGLLMFLAVMPFFRLLIDTKKSFPLQHKLSGFCMVLICINIFFIFIGYKYWGNIASIIVCLHSGVLIITTTYIAIRRKIEYAKYLFAGWIIIFIVSIIFNLRVWGIIPNNEFTLFLILVPIVVQAILLSLGLRGHAKKLALEKEDAIRLYQIAEGQAISKEAAFLQAQIKPHFLFNALNVIEALCYIDAKKAGEMILDLSVFLQHSYDFRNLQKYIPFDEEMEYIKAYVRIEQVRFLDKLKVEYELEDTESLMLPPLLLQPLIENAIKHGVRKNNIEGIVKIRVKSMPEHYRIEVEDNGEGLTEDAIKEALSQKRTQSGGVGLSNIQKRLSMFYRTNLIMESQVGVGTKVTILLPKERE